MVRGGVPVASPGVGSPKFWTYGAPLGLALHARCFGSSSKLLRERERESKWQQGEGVYEAGKNPFSHT